MDTTPLESKGVGGETARAFDEFMEAFEAFKEDNNARLAEIEQERASAPHRAARELAATFFHPDERAARPTAGSAETASAPSV